jgi:hypothetical protein
MLSIALVLAAASVTEQMAPAKQGMLQCQMPDVLFKTCFSLSKVYQTGPSTWMFDTQMLVDLQSPVIASIKDTASVHGSEVCNAASANEVSKFTFSLEGRPLPPAEAANYRAKLGKAYAALTGKMICTEIVPNEHGMKMVQATIDGKRFPVGDYAMKWVSPKDGWTVAP